ncbi:MAG: hypothetical protein JO023_23310 [Chloroflexi bacterium]|nr:hypothetical protein [Chloroflexota bacterium]
MDWYDQWQEWGRITSSYNSPPFVDMWQKPMAGLEDPSFQIMQDWRDVAFVAGREGTRNAAIEEINATFVIPTMVARAARGERIFKAHGIGSG